MLQDDQIYIGIDAGSVSIKIAVVAHASAKSIPPHIFSHSDKIPIGDAEYQLMLSQYQRIKGEPVAAFIKLFENIISHFPAGWSARIAVTGSNGRSIADVLGAPYLNEFVAVARGVGSIHPEVKTVLEIGGDSSKYIRIVPDPASGAVGIEDYEKNGDCAAGTGSFMDQQATRLLYKIEDVGDVVLKAERSATIAGRCSVFAKSDMIHAQQKGYKPEEILKGLCEAVVRNFKGSITKGKEIIPPVAFIGGVAVNKGIVQAVQKVFDLEDDAFLVPRYMMWMEAIGCALNEEDLSDAVSVATLHDLVGQEITIRQEFETSDPISMEKTLLLRDHVRKFQFPENGAVRCYLGIDIGSVTTKLVVIDENEDLVSEIYTKTEGRPIEVVSRGLRKIAEEIGHKIEIAGVGTTGSGRELIGELIGADTIRDEITAHKTGAMNVSEKLTGKKVDTIFDIGGQDSKYISIENGVVVDFTMNEACAAGTGSFLEEQAEKLGIHIKKEFSDLALSSVKPVRLGERCTVFMEKDITPFLQQGATKRDITAGLAFSIVYNYLNRVVRGRKIGDVIYFQGGTAYNDSVAGAFSTVLNKEIIVPPYNGVIGGIGAALLAKKKMGASGLQSTFRGFNLEDIDYSLRTFTCKGCSNFCEIQEFNVEGKKTYWGNKCSERYRKTIVRDRTPVIEDLIERRKKLLFPEKNDKSTGSLRIGCPRSMYFYDQFPFWSAYFSELGVDLVLSDETNRGIVNAGVETNVAEPCFPIVVAHGHIVNLMDKKVDYIFQPNVINAETNYKQTNSFLCPWGQTLCFVARQTPAFKSYWDKILNPNIRFAEGMEQVKMSLGSMCRDLGLSAKRSDLAVEAGYARQIEFKKQLLEKGRLVLETLKQNEEKAIVLLGRPYNIYDGTMNLNIPAKLRDYYGVNVIPYDYLAGDDVDIYDVTENMFWNYGRKILQVSKQMRHHPDLHLIYITNFKCGPDSYIKHYVRDAGQSPFLTLQFDGHGNDAGALTRCEAYLDSKGFLG